MLLLKRILNIITHYKRQNQKNKRNGKLVALSVNFLLSVIKFFGMLLDIGLGVIKFIFKPIRSILRFFYYYVVVKFYGLYLSFLKHMGDKGYKTNIISYFLNQKFVHVVVAVLTLTLVIINSTAGTKAGQISHSAGKTVLADLVLSEYEKYGEDEPLVVETFDQEGPVTDTQQTYLDNSGTARPKLGLNIEAEDGADDTDVTDAEILSARAGNIIESNNSEPKVIAKRTKVETYTVAKGDTISTIAQNFGINVSTILWENNLSAYSVIRPGDKLDILPYNGIRHKIARGETLSYIANKYDVSAKEVATANGITTDSTLSLGQSLMIPNGKKPAYVAPKTTKVKTYEAIKTIVKAPNANPVAGNKMQWPTVGHRITQYFNWRHNGLDIANKVGTPLYAADAGTVEIAGWGTGYGNEVLINHGGGKKTRYGHASKLFVKVGDKVKKGQTIAAMGSTGWSTGPHVHFEVIINGKRYNPLNYIK